MAQINEFLNNIDFETMREYCIANGNTVGYAKGDFFDETGRIGKYVGFVKSGYFKYCVLTSKGDYAVTGFSFADECIMDLPNHSFSTSLPKYQLLRDAIQR